MKQIENNLIGVGRNRENTLKCHSCVEPKKDRVVKTLKQRKEEIQWFSMSEVEWLYFD